LSNPDEKPDRKDKKPSRKAERAMEFLARLCEAHPEAFVARGQGRFPVPLSIGIHEELRARYPDEARHVIASAMRVYTGTMAYQRALADGGARIGLDGQPNGEVTPEQSGLARQRVKEALERRKAAKGRQGDTGVTDEKLARLKERFSR
jgi:ProP effector